MQKKKSADLCFTCVHRWLENFLFLKNNRFALGHDEDTLLNPMRPGAGKQSFRRLMKRFKTEAKSSVMHGNQSFGAEFEKGSHRLFRIHVNFATTWRFIGADGKQGNVDLVAFADILESRKVSAVATMKNGAAIHRDDKPAKVAMQVCEKSRAPMVTGRKRNLERSEFNRLPVIKLVHNLKAEIVHQISDANRHGDRLIGSYSAQCAPVEMIEMGVGHKDEIDRGQMMDLEAWPLQSFDDLEPLRPVRIN